MGLLNRIGVALGDVEARREDVTSPPGSLRLVLVVCALTLSAGFLLKAQCLQPWDGRQYARLCYNDLQPLFTAREIDRGTFPYVHGSLVDDQLVGGAMEYPVLTGVFMWVTGWFVDSPNAYLWISALLLAPFALVTAHLLARMTGRRALLWAAAPALVLYAFHNWDLLAVAASVAATWSWWRNRYVAAGAWLGVGACLKLYPLFFLVPLVVDRWLAGDRDAARRAALVGAGIPVALNLPFALINFGGWFATYTFHSQRGADFNSIWVWAFPSNPLDISLPPLPVPSLNAITALLTATSFAVALVWGHRRWRTDGAFPFVQVCAATLAAFMCWNKVHSPQYALWIMPFFVLLGVDIVWWAAYALADLVVYVGIFRWYYDAVYLGLDFTVAKRALIVGVWGRALLLVALFALFLRSREAMATGRRRSRAPPPPPPRRAAASESAITNGVP